MRLKKSKQKINVVKQLEIQQCRTCYNSTKGLRQLAGLTKCADRKQQKTYAELLKQVCHINVIDDLYGDQMPQLICESCARRLKTSHAFIQQTQEVNERLISIAGQVESSKQPKCLQEPSVDISPVNDIKAENEDMDFLGQLEPECFIELKVEEKELNMPVDNNSKDTLSLKTSEIPKTEVVTLFECPSSSLKESLNGNCENKVSDEQVLNDDEDNLYRSDTDSDWKDEDHILKNEKREKKWIPKSRKSAYNADDDIAVPCTECNKIFNNSKALARHKRNTHVPEEQKCKCPLCNRRFSRSCNMYKHMRTFHGPDSVPLIRKPSTKDRKFQCDKCERNYTKKSHLNLHIKEKHSYDLATQKAGQVIEDSEIKSTSDNGEKKDKPKKRYEVRSLCSICGSSFASRTHLVVHMRRHTGERPFKCDLCERAYPRPSELVCHRRIHTGEKPFKCKICDKAFRVWSKMSNHMRSHTDIRPYKCSQCERSFKYSKDLNIHFRIHTGERPYKCNVCGSTFTQSNTLKAHRSKLGHMDDGPVVKNNIG